VRVAEFRREVQHLSAFNLNDFPFHGAAFASPKSGRRQRCGKENHAFPWWVPSQFVLELRLRDLQHDEITRSCGEVNDLIARLLGEALPTDHLAHGDLP
jgi:hypothetical protein